MAKKLIPPEKFDLNARDLEIMRLNAVEGLSNQQTADQLGISLSTVKRTKSKDSYAALAQSALGDQGYSIAAYVQDLVAGTKAEKTVIQDGVKLTVPDHTARNQAMRQIGSIYGTEAPKDLDKRAGLSQMRDEEILTALATSIYEYTEATRQHDGTSVSGGTSNPQDEEDSNSATETSDHKQELAQ